MIPQMSISSFAVPVSAPWPFREAQISSGYPSLLAALTLAPQSTRNIVTASWPFYEAWISGVNPSISLLTSAPWS
ncbi:uncharacterized protein BDW70DRAFT_144529, partial [Aspergillus foveolatus]|uniref:uncharacterized protein n=1 Tax=Aspergillus foveolatus TaxID=210207 RepID=UPI003CCC929E